MRLDLDRIRQDVEGFNIELLTEVYQNYAGFKEEMNTSAVYDKYAHLFTRENIVASRELREKAEGEEQRRLRMLQSFFVAEHMQNIVKRLTDEHESLEAKEVVQVEGETLPFRLAAVKISNEPSRSRRSALFEGRNQIIESKMNPVLATRMRRLHESAKELGYANYIQLYSNVKGIDFGRVEHVMRTFLERTERPYADVMGHAVEEKLDVGLREAEKHDIAYLFRAKEFDPFFVKERMVSTLKQTLAGLGINLEAQGNILLDVEERPKKTPRAFVVPIRVPDEIRLVVMPKGGHDDYAALFHESGHAEHFAHVEPTLPVEYKYLGGNSTTETYAFLMEYLTMDRSWIQAHLKMEKAGEYLDFQFLYKLYFLRRYAAKLTYELTLHQDGLEGMPDEYRRTLEKALKFRHPAGHYLVDVDDGFYTAEYLRAWMFEAQLRSRLKERFGATWFEKPAAGRFLRELWSTGQKFDVEELAHQIGERALDAAPLAAEILEHYGT